MKMDQETARLRIARGTQEAEQAVNEALLTNSRLFATLVEARRETESPAFLGHQELIRLAKGQQGLLDAGGARQQKSDTPQRGEFVAAHGHGPEPDLEAGVTGAQWRKAALAAYLQGIVTPSRVIELLYDALTEDELPRQELEDPLP